VTSCLSSPCFLRAAAALAALLLCGACTKKIGDDCKSSLDCSQDSERTCDISQPGGYCTIEGCDERSCPKESACIRFFPRLFLTRPCPPDCAPDELCVGGLCAPRASERRNCSHTCGENGDCRGGYVCLEAGKDGTLALTSDPDKKVSFCAPATQ
jgi:hypothetical protein